MSLRVGNQALANGLLIASQSAFTSSEQIVAIGISSETDSALAATTVHSLILGIAAETDSGLAAARLKNKAVGQAESTSFALPFGAALGAELGLPVEFDIPQALTRNKEKLAEESDETDFVFPMVVGAPPRILNQALETDFSLPPTRVKTLAIGQPFEVDLALIPHRAYTMGLALETDSVFGMAVIKTGEIVIPIGLTLEADSTFSLQVLKFVQPIGLAQELDSVFGLTIIKAGLISLPIGIAEELDLAQSLLVGRHILVNQASEFDEALAALHAKTHAIGLTLETDAALTMVIQTLRKYRGRRGLGPPPSRSIRRVM